MNSFSAQLLPPDYLSHFPWRKWELRSSYALQKPPREKVENGKELTTAFGGLIRNHSGLQLFFASWMEVR